MKSIISFLFLIILLLIKVDYSVEMDQYTQTHFFSERDAKSLVFNAIGKLTVKNIFSKAKTEEKATG